jgi:RND family efflux transporter MFP subunit
MALKCLTCLAVLFLAFFIWNCDSSESNAAGAAEERIPVEVKTIELGEVVQSLSYNGDYLDEGDKVRKGQLVARIFSTTIEQAVRQAEAGLVVARAQEANLRLEYERAQRLYQGNALSKQQYDAIETQYEAAKAQTEQAEAMLKTAQSQLDDARVSAPISGIIGKRYSEAGDMATLALPLVSIVQMDRVKICFDVTEIDLGRLKTGQDAVIRVRSYPDLPFKGKVSKISPVLDPLTRMAEVEVLIDNPQHLLKPGMFARVEVTTGTIRDVIVVPRYTTIENTILEKVEGRDRVIKNYYVFVADSNRAEQRKLEVLYANHQYLAISSGIRVGEKLVTLGQNMLRDSAKVMIVNEE